jgi:hypothetical protein
MEMVSLASPSPLDILEPAACGCFEDPEICMCLAAERALRHVIRTRGKLTEEQREWCLTEIDQVEGYDRSTLAGYADDDVAQAVLNAWADYARDKGML